MLNCDTFPAIMHISSKFPCSFSLPMIVDITGSISIYHEFGPAALASIEVDDLRYLGRLDLDLKSWNMELMSMGKL